MSANYNPERVTDEFEPFVFLLPNQFKSKIVFQDGYSIPLKTPKPNVFRRFLTWIVLGWTYQNYK